MEATKLKLTQRKVDELGVSLGMRFGDWEICSAEVRKHKSHDYVWVKCPHTTNWLAIRHLTSGKSRGCRKCCYTRNTKWTEEESRLRDLHIAILQRCFNPNNRHFKHYGGRGICVSDEFKDPRIFIDYLISLPNRTEGMQIDRINNEGNYERGNLRWANKETQVGNRRNSIRIIWGGEEMSMSQFARRFTNVSEAYAAQLFRRGLSLKEIIEYEPNLHKAATKKIDT